MEASDTGFPIEPGAADRQSSDLPRGEIGESRFVELAKGPGGASVQNVEAIDEMMRDPSLVLNAGFGRSEFELPVDLAAVQGEDFPAFEFCPVQSDGAFTDGGGAGDVGDRASGLERWRCGALRWHLWRLGWKWTICKRVGGISLTL